MVHDFGNIIDILVEDMISVNGWMWYDRWRDFCKWV